MGLLQVFLSTSDAIHPASFAPTTGRLLMRIVGYLYATYKPNIRTYDATWHIIMIMMSDFEGHIETL